MQAHLYFIYIKKSIPQLMTVERIHPKAPVMLIFIAIFTCLPSCINLSNIDLYPIFGHQLFISNVFLKSLVTNRYLQLQT